jgi:hypothetical protein
MTNKFEKPLSPEVAQHTLNTALMVAGVAVNADKYLLVDAVKANIKDFLRDSPDQRSDAELENEAWKAIGGALRVLMIYQQVVERCPPSVVDVGKLYLKNR